MLDLYSMLPRSRLPRSSGMGRLSHGLSRVPVREQSSLDLHLTPRGWPEVDITPSEDRKISVITLGERFAWL